MIVIPMKLYEYLLTCTEVLHANYYNIHEHVQKRYLIQTKSQARTSGIILPRVHGLDKGVDPNIQPEKQIIRPVVSYMTIPCFDSLKRSVSC